MTVDTERLRQLATAATPGPWTADGDLIVQDGSGGHRVRIFGADTRDPEFIAAANPTTVLALLDRIAALENALLGGE